MHRLDAERWKQQKGMGGLGGGVNGIWGRVREDGEKVERGREEGSGRMLRVKTEGGHTGKK